jgi:hypothetical protein
VTREEFQAVVRDGVAKLGEREVARRCCVSFPTVRRWAAGETAPMPLGRPSVKAVLER